MMACIGAGCSEEEHSGYYLRGDKLACNKGCHVIKYSPQEVKDLPEFLHAQEIEAYDDFFSWYGTFIWTGKVDGKRYYSYYNTSMSHGSIFTETGEICKSLEFANWTDIEVIWIHPKYIEYHKENNEPLSIMVP